jgi:hypothetical protein
MYASASNPRIYGSYNKAPVARSFSKPSWISAIPFSNSPCSFGRLLWREFCPRPPAPPQFPTIAQQVDGIDLSRGDKLLWLEVYHKLKDAKKRGVELSEAQARQEALEPVRQENLGHIIDAKDDKGDIEGIERWLASLRSEMDRDVKAIIDRQEQEEREQEETAQRQRRAG